MSNLSAISGPYFLNTEINSFMLSSFNPLYIYKLYIDSKMHKDQGLTHPYNKYYGIVWN